MSALFFIADCLDTSELSVTSCEAMAFFNPHRFVAGRNLFFGGGGGDTKIKETSEERELSKIALEKWDIYQDIGAPLEDEYMDQVDSLDTEAAYDFASGAAGQNVHSEFSDVKDRVEKRELSSGINPNSGRFKAATAEFSDVQGASAGENKSRAQVTQQDEHVRGLSNVINLGQGQATSAQTGMGGLAELSASKAKSDAIDAFNEGAATREAAGTVLGAAAGYGLNRNPPETGGSEMIAGRQGDVDYTPLGLRPGQAFT